MLDLKKLLASFHYAYQGIVHAYTNNQNLRIAFLGGALVSLASIFFKVSPFEMGILGVMILLVICAEMINTSLEEMANLIVTEHHKEAKIAKDVAAGMVLVTLVGSILVGLLIFIPHIGQLFFSY